MPGQQRYATTCPLLAATLSAHDSAAFGVHVPAGLCGDVPEAGVCSAGGPLALSGAPMGVGSWLAEVGGERSDGFEQQSIGAGLLAGGPAGAELGDGAAMLGLGGELPYPGGHGWVDDGGRAARVTSRG